MVRESPTKQVDLKTSTTSCGLAPSARACPYQDLKTREGIGAIGEAARDCLTEQQMSGNVYRTWFERGLLTPRAADRAPAHVEAPVERVGGASGRTLSRVARRRRSDEDALVFHDPEQQEDPDDLRWVGALGKSVYLPAPGLASRAPPRRCSSGSDSSSKEEPTRLSERQMLANVHQAQIEIGILPSR